MSPSSSILTPSRRPLSSQIGLAHTLIAPHLILSMPLSLSSSSSSFTSCSSSTSEQSCASCPEPTWDVWRQGSGGEAWRGNLPIARLGKALGGCTLGQLSPGPTSPLFLVLPTVPSSESEKAELSHYGVPPKNNLQ